MHDYEHYIIGVNIIQLNIHQAEASKEYIQEIKLHIPQQQKVREFHLVHHA